MLIQNVSVGVINIDNKNILPQQKVYINDSYVSSVVVKGLIKAGKLVELKTKEENTETIENIVDVEEEFEHLLSEKPTLAKIKKFANEHQISLEDAKTFDEVEAVIKAFIAVTKANN